MQWDSEFLRSDNFQACCIKWMTGGGVEGERDAEESFNELFTINANSSGWNLAVRQLTVKHLTIFYPMKCGVFYLENMIREAFFCYLFPLT